MIIEYYNNGIKTATKETNFKEALERIEIARLKARKSHTKTDKPHTLYAIKFYNNADQVEKVHIFSNTHLTEEELHELPKKYPRCYFGVLHKECQKVCKKILEIERTHTIKTIPLKDANQFVDRHHRHHKGTVGCKFAIGLYERNELIGVAICGRPVSRHLDNGDICEINRLCTIKGYTNACSQLYSQCAKIAQAMGYKKIITYILQSENGASLRASNFVCEGVAGGTHWTGKRNKGQNIPHELKTRWTRNLN